MNVLDWRYDNWRFRSVPEPCRYCGGLCHLTDDEHCPAHKVCVEAALTARSQAVDTLPHRIEGGEAA